MKHSCQHCGARYQEFLGHEGFCCAGCQQVYHLIQQEGLDGYYALQDRIGQKPELVRSASSKWVKGFQEESEAREGICSAQFTVSGMSCVGCAWLVEKLIRSQPHVSRVRVNLESNSVEIEWLRGGFDLFEALEQCLSFGYELKPYETSNHTRLSPLMWRICLCLLFATNGWLIAALPKWGVDFSVYGGLLQLIQWFMAGLSFVVGASFFIIPAVQSLKLSRLHFDTLPAVGLIVGYICSFVGLDGFQLWQCSVWCAGLLLTRWLLRNVWSSIEHETLGVDAKALRILPFIVGMFMLIGLVTFIGVGLFGALSVLFSVSLYPLARALGYQPSGSFVAFVVVCALIGLYMSWSFQSVGLAIVWQALSGSVCCLLYPRFPLSTKQLSS